MPFDDSQALRIPRFPRIAALPLGVLPTSAHSRALAALLNQVFAGPLANGELGFLEHRVLRIHVRDAGVTFRLTLGSDRLTAHTGTGGADVSIEGAAYDFLLLMTRSEDPDTLFFHRRLSLGGDTELGLYIKNFLDAFEPHPQLARVLATADRILPLIERLG
ncbi:MAG: SCP2 sterol-binding domain-containing protein [Pseudomonadota bacterium]|nr:MAG: SCP2 sterol-binding domain-containing protein [Pseudomonadota bacterium]